MILKYSYIQIKLLRSNLTDNELNYHASYWTEGSLNHINLKDFHKGWIHQRAGAKQARVMSCMIPAVVKCMLFPRRSAARLGSEAPTIGTPILAATSGTQGQPMLTKSSLEVRGRCWLGNQKRADLELQRMAGSFARTSWPSGCIRSIIT